MIVTRRQVFQSLALTAGCGTAAEGADPEISLQALRDVSVADGVNLTDDRLRVLKPILEHRLPQLRALRDFEIDDSVEPTQGILGK